MQVVFALERENLVEISSFVPQLELAGRVARVGAALKHRDEHDFDFDRCGI